MEKGVSPHLISSISAYRWQAPKLPGLLSLGEASNSFFNSTYILKARRYRYGTPFLLSLGISEQLTSLVWLAGPISGLIAQPVIGERSEEHTSELQSLAYLVCRLLL